VVLLKVKCTGKLFWGNCFAQALFNSEDRERRLLFAVCILFLPKEKNYAQTFFVRFCFSRLLFSVKTRLLVRSHAKQKHLLSVNTRLTN
jgi:hypothetical protein